MLPPPGNGSFDGPRWDLQASAITRRNHCSIEKPIMVDLSLRSLEEDESGVCSPPLWSNSPPATPRFRSLTLQNPPASSRYETIDAGRKEMMELVRGLPESCYELSLQDLVELPLKKGGPEEEKAARKTATKASSGKKSCSRKAVNEGPFLLKMFVPVVLVGKKKIDGKGKGAKVSPKPPPSPAPADMEKAGLDCRLEGDGLKRCFPVAEEQKSNGRSSSDSRSRGGFSTGCTSFFTTASSKGRDGKHKSRH